MLVVGQGVISLPAYIPVVREHGVLQHNFLQQLNQLIGQVSGHEGLHGDGDVLGVLGLGQGGLDHLVDQGSPVLVLVIEDLGPELHVPPLDQVAGLGLEQTVLIADSDQLSITVAPLVSFAGQMGVSLLTVLAHHLAVVVLVLHQEPFSIVVGVYVNFCNRIVCCWLYASLMHPERKE